MNIQRHRDAFIMDPEMRHRRCQHRFIAKATNIIAAIKRAGVGFVFDGDTKRGIFLPYAEVEYCTNRTCDRVFYAEETV